MKNSTITIYLSTLSLVFLCFGCLPDKQQSNTKEVPSEAIALAKSAAAKTEAKDLQGCIEDANQALSIYNNYAQAHFLKGVCQYLTGQVQEGISSIETASKIAQSKGRNDIAQNLSAKADELKKSSNITPSPNDSPEDKPRIATNGFRPTEEVLRGVGIIAFEPGMSEQDNKFLQSVEDQLYKDGLIRINGRGERNGVVWDTWNTLDWKEKVKIGHSACQTMGDPLAAIDTLLSSYGDSTKSTLGNLNNKLAAGKILNVGVKIYCPEVRAEGNRTLKRQAQQTLDDQEDEMVKKAIDLTPTCLALDGSCKK